VEEWLEREIGVKVNVREAGDAGTNRKLGAEEEFYAK
jgi:hypothetical protein